MPMGKEGVSTIPSKASSITFEDRLLTILAEQTQQTRAMSAILEKVSKSIEVLETHATAGEPSDILFD